MVKKVIKRTKYFQVDTMINELCKLLGKHGIQEYTYGAVVS